MENKKGGADFFYSWKTRGVDFFIVGEQGVTDFADEKKPGVRGTTPLQGITDFVDEKKTGVRGHLSN